MHPSTLLLLSREQWAQRTPAWYERRKTLITASDAGPALNIPMFSNQRNPRETCIREKVEKKFKGNHMTRWGQENEPMICQMLEDIFDEKILDVGLLVHNTHSWLGASPDGVMEKTGRLVEIKAPYKRQVVPGGHVPKAYWCQMQVQMEVSDIDQTVFCQWQPAHLNHENKEVLDIVVVQRDRAWFDRHVNDLHLFWKDLMRARQQYVSPPTKIKQSMYRDLIN